MLKYLKVQGKKLRALRIEGNESMRKHLRNIVAVMSAVCALGLICGQAFAAETEPAVDTITIDSEDMWVEDVPADLCWKTSQDKGQWIEELGIGEDVNSLILIINNLDKGDPDALPNQEALKNKTEKKTKKAADGKSRMTYFTRNADGEWEALFNMDCYISGGDTLEKENVYGVYAPVITFGLKEDPGSLLPFHAVGPNDFWILDPESEDYGMIYTTSRREEKPLGSISLEGLKSFSNYGMILHSETDQKECPALMINCQQREAGDDTICGIQMPQSYLRMLIQTVDEDTRVLIAGDLEDLKPAEGETEQE